MTSTLSPPTVFTSRIQHGLLIGDYRIGVVDNTLEGRLEFGVDTSFAFAGTNLSDAYLAIHTVTPIKSAFIVVLPRTF